MQINRLIGYIEATFLPIILAVIFVIQNQAFNLWLGIYSKTYSVRLSLVTFALGIILYGPSLLFKKKLKYIYLFLISFLVSLVFFAQFIYYTYSQSFLQFSAIRYVGEAGGVVGTIKILLTPNLLIFAASIAVVLFALLLTLRKNHVEVVSPQPEKIFIIVVMVIMVIIGYRYLLDTEKKEWGSTSRLYTDVYDLKSLVGKMGIINFFLEDTFKYALRSNLVSSADKKFLQNWEQDRAVPLTGTKTPPKYFGAEKGKNLIIIQVESLENCVIDQTIGGEEITPNLNQLAKDGLYFNNYYTQDGPGNTADAEFSTMDSLYPLYDDVVFINYAKNQYHALPQLLANNGYKTYSLHGDVPTFWNRSNIYPGLGYQKMFDLDDYVVTRPVGDGPSDLGDEDLFSQSLPRLESFKQPFMATLITMSSHTPFILPTDLQTLNVPSQTNLTQTQWEYLQSVHYADKAIGEFIDGLKKDGLYDNSLIFIWGDHGSFTNISLALGQDKNTLPELANSQVPMIILAPGLNSKGADNIPSSHLDIYPTITNLLGIATPQTVLGQDLFNTTTPVETHFKLISGGIDAILTPNMAYQAGTDGEFSEGSCESWPDQKSLPINNCQDLYNRQSDSLKASNIIIRGNLLNVLLDKKK
ncbi:MAG: LTA synthase family protein [Candidatus Staskawiczbacteria bacterium]|jgi:phosphoglycerol transferase MdoB-like AlkP superfamily enzyme